MIQVLKIFEENSLDFSTEALKSTTTMLIKTGQEVISKLLQEIDSENLNWDQFPMFGRNLGSGLTNQAGVYIIINRRTKKFYIGSSADLAQRKGEHSRNFKNPGRLGSRSVINPAISADLEAPGSYSDFYFAAVFCFPHTQRTGASSKILDNSFCQDLFDLTIEKGIIEHFLTDEAFKNRCYNTRSIGRFERGNTFGGSPQSGSPAKPVALLDAENGKMLYAWESVTAAANSLGLAPATIRNYRTDGKLVEISTSEYESFEGPKISNAEATYYFNNKQDLRADIANRLQPRRRR